MTNYDKKDEIITALQELCNQLILERIRKQVPLAPGTMTTKKRIDDEISEMNIVSKVIHSPSNSVNSEKRVG